MSRALRKSERVLDKVEHAALDLSSVNAVLKAEVDGGVALANVEQALSDSEAVEVEVEAAAAELVLVNDALAEEIDQRRQLEQRLARTDAALSKSRVNERRASHSALHDALTGLANLTLFVDRLRTAIAQADRHGWRLAVMFVDLDAFKEINDAHGHDVGDQVLQVVAKRLETAVRARDTVSRRSGDEFLVLMLEARDEATVLAFSARLLESLAEPCILGGVTLTPKASIGIALYPEDGRSTADLLRCADAAMYVAKQEKTGSALYRRTERP